MPRLDQLLSRALGVSRTQLRAAIAAGRVLTEEGRALDDPREEIPAGALPLPVRFDGRPLVLHEQVSLLLHKPLGVVTALRDERHPTAYALLRDAPLWSELRPVGRLDLDTSGLLLWTTDGQWLQRLTHPKRAVPRTYQAVLARPFAPPPPELVLEDGHRPHLVSLVTLETGALHPALVRHPEAGAFAEITLSGGAYHEVRRIFAALGSHVLSLCRTRFGQLTLPLSLPPGAHKLITPEEVVAPAPPEST